MAIKTYSLCSPAVICVFIFALFSPVKSQSNENQTMSDICKADFSYMIEKVQQNYAGYSDKVLNEHEQKLKELTEKLYHKIEAESDPDSCTVLLKQWINFFNDNHLQINVLNSDFSITNKTVTSSTDSWFPSLKFLDDETAHLKIPSFDLIYKFPLDSLLNANMSHLLICPKIIIDISGNGGGGDPTFNELIQLIYTNPMEVKGAKILASEDNISFFKSLIDKKEIPEPSKEFIRKLIKKMNQGKGEFVCMVNDTIITQPIVHEYPKIIAIITDSKVASSAEEFLLYAQQSTKVTIFGSNTQGTLDYSNLIPMELPSGYRNRTLWIPTTKRSYLSEFSVDAEGIKPNVRIPENVDDKLAYVIDYLVGMSKN